MKKLMIAIIVAMVLLIPTVTIAQSDWVDELRQCVENVQLEPHNARAYMPFRQMQLIDLDFDGIPELVISENESSDSLLLWGLKVGDPDFRIEGSQISNMDFVAYYDTSLEKYEWMLSDELYSSGVYVCKDVLLKREENGIELYDKFVEYDYLGSDLRFEGSSFMTDGETVEDAIYKDKIREHNHNLIRVGDVSCKNEYGECDLTDTQNRLDVYDRLVEQYREKIIPWVDSASAANSEGALAKEPSYEIELETGLAGKPTYLTEIETGYEVDLNGDGKVDTITWERQSHILNVNNDYIRLQYGSTTDMGFDDRYVGIGDIDVSDNYTEIFVLDIAYGDFAHPEINILRYDGNSFMEMAINTRDDDGKLMENKVIFYTLKNVVLLGNGTLEYLWDLGSYIGNVEYKRVFKMDSGFVMNEEYDDNEYNYTMQYVGEPIEVVQKFTAYAERSFESDRTTVHKGQRIEFISEDRMGWVYFTTSDGQRGYFRLRNVSNFLNGGYAMFDECAPDYATLDDIFSGDKSFGERWDFAYD